MAEYKLPQTKYGMHNLLIELQSALEGANSYGQDWDLHDETLEAFEAAEGVLLQDWTRYDKEEVPEGYENLPYKVEDHYEAL